MIATRELARHLRSVADQERIQVSDQALALVARAAEGSARDALSLFDQVLAFTGDAVKDEEVAGLLGLVDRELLRRATRAIVDGSSLAMLELVESLADYGADYRNFVRELLLYLREVLLRESGQLIGIINSHHCDSRVGEFMYGIAIRREHQRGGYASEAIILLMRYFFDELRYQKCTVDVHGWNDASVKLHEKLGFVREGQVRRSLFTEGKHFDRFIYGMTIEEFRERYR